MTVPSPESAIELDLAFLAIYRDLTQATLGIAQDGTRRVVDLSAAFLSDAATRAVKDFHAMYFGDAAMNATAEDVNREVDDLVEGLLAAREAGADVAAAAGERAEDEAARTRRLSLAGLHRQLESLVQLDAGVKRRLMPVLSAMQFEDLARHRLGNLQTAWDTVMNGLIAAAGGGPALDADQAAREIAAALTSQAERAAFYRDVLREAAPAGLAEEHPEGLVRFEID